MRQYLIELSQTGLDILRLMTWSLEINPRIKQSIVEEEKNLRAKNCLTIKNTFIYTPIIFFSIGIFFLSPNNEFLKNEEKTPQNC